MRVTLRIFLGILAASLPAAGCTAPVKTPDEPVVVADFDTGGHRAPYRSQAAVQVVSIADGDWNVSTNPRLEWTANPDAVGTVLFASVQIFEVVGETAADAPCVTIDDTGGALARANGGMLFKPVDGVLVSFMGSHAGRKELKPATTYLLILTLSGRKKEEKATIRFTTR